MIEWIAKLIQKNKGELTGKETRQMYGVICGGVGIGLNILLFCIKAFAGFVSGSVAIIADSLNNLSDAGSSIITLVGFRMAGQKPDSDHPFGHGRIEYISGFLVSIIILIMAFELFKSSVSKILHPEAVETSTAVYLILIFSIIIKVYMFYYNRKISRKISSEAMDATAKDSLSDSVATLAVLFTTFVAQKTGLLLDGYCGILVACFVFMAGYSAAKETIDPLLGQPPESSFVRRVEEIIMEYKDQGVLGIHDLVIHNYGPGRVMLSVHVEVPSTGDIMVLHDMIDLIEHRLAGELECSAVIHMDPVCVDDERTNSLRKMVKDIIEEMEGEISFHDFRIVQGPTHTNLIFDVVVPFDYGMTDQEVVQYLRRKISQIDPTYFAVIEVDKSFA